MICRVTRTDSITISASSEDEARRFAEANPLLFEDVGSEVKVSVVAAEPPKDVVIICHDCDCVREIADEVGIAYEIDEDGDAVISRESFSELKTALREEGIRLYVQTAVPVFCKSRAI